MLLEQHLSLRSTWSLYALIATEFTLLTVFILTLMVASSMPYSTFLWYRGCTEYSKQQRKSNMQGVQTHQCAKLGETKIPPEATTIKSECRGITSAAVLGVRTAVYANHIFSDTFSEKVFVHFTEEKSMINIHSNN